MTSQPVSAPAAPPVEVPPPVHPVRETAGALVTSNGPGPTFPVVQIPTGLEQPSAEYMVTIDSLTTA